MGDHEYKGVKYKVYQEGECVYWRAAYMGQEWGSGLYISESFPVDKVIQLNIEHAEESLDAIIAKHQATEDNSLVRMEHTYKNTPYSVIVYGDYVEWKCAKASDIRKTYGERDEWVQFAHEKAKKAINEMEG